jgi:hypothetical protein
LGLLCPPLLHVVLPAGQERPSKAAFEVVQAEGVFELA